MSLTRTVERHSLPGAAILHSHLGGTQTRTRLARTAEQPLGCASEATGAMTPGSQSRHAPEAALTEAHGVRSRRCAMPTLRVGLYMSRPMQQPNTLAQCTASRDARVWSAVRSVAVRFGVGRFRAGANSIDVALGARNEQPFSRGAAERMSRSVIRGAAAQFHARHARRSR